MVFDQKVLEHRVKSDHYWWKSRKPVLYADLSKRAYFEGFNALINDQSLHRAVVLMGPRRVGKTVMMYQAIQSLLDAGIQRNKILYFSLDTPLFTNLSLERMIDLALLPNSNTIDGCYIFFDEIQYLKDWEVHLKSLVDRNRKTKFIASGSAAAALKMKSLESGAGRFSDYFLPPLTFAEYIELNAYDNLLEAIEVDFGGKRKFYRSKNINELNVHFTNYINFGGFPEIALNSAKVKNPEQVIQKDITDKVIMKDLPGLFGIENTLELQQFFNVIAYRTGEILNFQHVAKETATDSRTVRKYLEYLESAFLIKILHRVDITAKRFKKITQFKVYLTNPSLYTGLFGRVQQEDERFPHLVETAVFAQYLHREHNYLRYANWKRNNREGEVDLIQLSRTFQRAKWALEVKWSDELEVGKLKFFMRKNNIPKGIVTSKTKFKDGEDLLIVPNSVFAYVVGKNALESGSTFAS